MEPYVVRAANAGNFDHRIDGTAGSGPDCGGSEERPVSALHIVADRPRKALRVHSETGVDANPPHVSLSDPSGDRGFFHRRVSMLRNIGCQFAGRADVATPRFDP